MSTTAIAVRDALFAAKEPDVLLFQELPAACGFGAFSPTEDARDFHKFFRTSREALAELQRSYDDLLTHATDVRSERLMSVPRREGRNCSFELGRLLITRLNLG